MKITLTQGTGRGATLLSAFDSALQACGVCNYNLLVLSSVIPPASIIVQEKYVSKESEYGDRLYVVRAEMRSDIKDEWIGGAVGWYLRSDNGGLFVEHETKGKTKEEVEDKLRSDVTNSLKDLCAFRGYPCEESNIHMELEVAQVTEKPTCILVMAVYQSQSWEDK